MSIDFIINIVSRSLLMTIIVCIPLSVARVIYLKIKTSTSEGYNINTRRESILWMFTFYIVILYQITVYRYGISLDFLAEPRPKINLSLLTEIIKIYKHGAIWSFIYNIAGNILWFVPFGMLYSALIPKKSLLKTAISGCIVSISIETMQFIFNTGISDIDDVLFNTVGAILGYVAFFIVSKHTNQHKH